MFIQFRLLNGPQNRNAGCSGKTNIGGRKMRTFEDFQREDGKHQVCQVLDTDGCELHYYVVIRRDLTATQAKRLAKQLNV